jgi:hypothetical protein
MISSLRYSYNALRSYFDRSKIKLVIPLTIAFHVLQQSLKVLANLLLSVIQNLKTRANISRGRDLTSYLMRFISKIRILCSDFWADVYNNARDPLSYIHFKTWAPALASLVTVGLSTVESIS